MKKCKYTLLILITAILAVPDSRASEVQERNVDEAALSSQDEAIRTLRATLKKARGTPQESLFLFKLATIQQQAGQMQFRVEHGDSHASGKALKLSRYESYMKDSIKTLDELLEKFPAFEQAARAVFMRGKAHEEVKQQVQATRDYLHMRRAYPGAAETLPATMSLADFAIKDNNHALAISFLKTFESLPNDTHFGQAMYKMAWSLYSLKKIPEALRYTERLLAHYDARIAALKDAGSENLLPAEQQLRDGILSDATVFVHEGSDLRLAGFGGNSFDAKGALAYFRKIGGSDDAAFGRMIVRYAKLLRSHDHRADLHAWKSIVLAQESKRTESLDVLLSTYEYQMNRQFFADISATAAELAAHHGRMSEEQQKLTEKLLLDTAKTIQSLMVQYKDTNKIPSLGSQIAAVYEAFTKIVDEDDARVRTIRVNLAETLFAIREYESATNQYRWIIKTGSWSETEKTSKNVTGGITVSQASLRSIGARYESLRQRGLVPGELTAVAPSKKDRANLDAVISEWIVWIDEHASEVGMAGLENFVFEANRVLYAQGQINLALERLNRFALKYPTSKFAVPSASLVMDTVIAGKQWDEVVKTADSYLAVSEWSKTPFSTRVYAIAADSQFKRAESLASHRDHSAAIEQAQRLLSKYGSHERAIDALAIAANAAMAMNQRDQAVGFYTQLAARPEKDVSLPALKTIAKIEEDRFALSSAATAHVNYLNRAKLSSSDASALRRRILSLAWLGGDVSQLSGLLAQKPFCAGALRAECERYQALGQLMTSKRASDATAARNAQKAPEHTRAIWATAALENLDALSPNMRHRMIEVVSRNWNKTEAMAKFSLSPRLTKSIPRVFALDREAIRGSGTLVADERVILKRIHQIRSMEEGATVAASLPWTEMRGQVLTQVGGAYEDLASGLKELPAPKGLSANDQKTYGQMVAKLARPYEQKAQNVRSQARGLLDSSKSLDAGDLGWSSANYNTGTRDEIFRARWKQALSSQNWPMVAYFIQEAEKKGLLNRSELSNAKAVSLALATNTEGT
jgi:outer membrane protein assembly factor BamD (BamD/ComL family)